MATFVRKKVLILAYYWPPSSGSGVQRWLKFSKYLPQFGWDPVIITPEKGTAPYYDESLLKDVLPGVEVIKTKTLEPFALYNRLQGKKPSDTIPVGMMGLKDSKSRFQKVAGFIRANLFVPDARKGWAPFAAEAAIKRIRQGDIAAFVTTGPPHSTHLAGLKVKQATGLPWIADLRDPWVNIYYNKDLPRLPYFRQKDQAYENAVLAKADAVTVVSPGMVNEFGPRSKRIELIYNGYDTEDLPQNAAPAPTDAFILSHIGNFFPSLDSDGLRQALVQLMADVPGFRNQFRLDFTGMTDPFVMERFRAAGLESMCRFNPPVGHKQAVKLMFGSSGLLFSISRDGDAKVLLSGKLFEYLATGLPILSLGDPQGAAAILLKNASHAPMLDYDDVEGIKSRILSLYQAWLANGKTATPLPKSDIEKYSRRALTGEMASLLGSISQ